MTALLLLGLTAHAFQAAPDVYIGHEPQRLRRTHSPAQFLLRTGEAWQAFLAGDGAGWEARFDEWTGTPHRAWGPGIDLGPTQTQAQVEAGLQAFFARNAKMLGVDADELQLSAAGYVEESQTWYVRFDRVVPTTTSIDPDGDGDGGVILQAALDSVPVWRGAVEARIRFGKLILLGVDTFPDADSVDTTPTLSDATAIEQAIALGPVPDAGHTIDGARLVVLPLEEEPGLVYHLAWETRTRTGGAGPGGQKNGEPVGIWVSHVDAHTGELLNVYNEVRFFEGTVTGTHDTRTVDGNKSSSPLVNLEVEAGDSSTYTDSDGIYALSSDGPFSGALNGKYVKVKNKGGSTASFDWSSSDFDVTTDDADQAEIDSYVFLEGVRVWGKTYASNNSMVTGKLTSNVNLNDICNAYFDGDVNFYSAGGGCNNTGRILDVNYHEWGHGFHYYNLISGTWDGSISEGIGDTVAVLNTGDPLVGPYFWTNGAGIREVDSDHVYPDDFGSEVHENGLIFAGAVWDLWSRLEDDYSDEDAYDLLNQLFVDGLKGGPEIPDSFDEFVSADDDDGDLGNGTPNLCAILDAFSLHGLGPGGESSLLSVGHEPLENQVGVSGGYPLEAAITNLAPACVDFTITGGTVFYSTDNGASWSSEALSIGTDSVTGSIPEQPDGTIVTYYVEVESSDGDVVNAPTGGEINPFTFYVGELEEIWCTDLEDDDGDFTHDLVSGSDELGADDWDWGRPRGEGGDPDQAYSGTRVWGNNLGAGSYDGEYMASKENRLTSPTVDVSGHDRLVLQYRRWLTVEDGYYDQARITANGTTIWSNHKSSSSVGDEHHIDQQWALHTVELPIPEDGQLALAWEIESDRGLEMGGWNLDDVCIYSAHEADTTGDDGGGDGAGDGTGEEGGLDLNNGDNEISVSACAGCASGAPGGGAGTMAGLLVGLAALLRRRREA